MVYAYSPSSSSLLGGLGLLLTLLSCIGIINAQKNDSSCSTYDNSCNECLENSPCVWVPVAGCLESCDLIADTSCYSPEYFTESSTDEICAVATNDESNSNLCNSQTDCTTCVDTTLIGNGDGTNTCQWFPNDDGGGVGYCGHECGMMGCGELTCDANANDGNDRIKINECENNISCRDCLGDESSSSCGWVTGMGCLESCNIIADVNCYDNGYDNGGGLIMTGDDICTVAENDIADMDICNSQTDCTTCIETSLVSSDPSTATNCRWFSEGNFCGSECNMIGCGETTCTADSYNIGDGIENAGSSSSIDNNGSDLNIMETTTSTGTSTSTGTPPSSSVDAVESSTAAQKYNYFLVWTTATLVVVASCLL